MSEYVFRKDLFRNYTLEELRNLKSMLEDHLIDLFWQYECLDNRGTYDASDFPQMNKLPEQMTILKASIEEELEERERSMLVEWKNRVLFHPEL